MDIGFEGGFTCLKRSVNASLHSYWIKDDNGDTVNLAVTGFHTVFANDIRLDAKSAKGMSDSEIFNTLSGIFLL